MVSYVVKGKWREKLRTILRLKQWVYQLRQRLRNYFRSCKNGTANTQSRRATNCATPGNMELNKVAAGGGLLRSPVAVPCVRLADGAAALHTDRCHSLPSLHLPLAALGSLPKLSHVRIIIILNKVAAGGFLRYS